MSLEESPTGVYEILKTKTRFGLSGYSGVSGTDKDFRHEEVLVEK